MAQVISPGNLEISAKRKEANKRLVYQTEVSQLRLFIGFCNGNCRLVPNMAKLARPLNPKLENGESTRFELNDSEKVAVDMLNHKLTSTPVLTWATLGQNVLVLCTD